MEHSLNVLITIGVFIFAIVQVFAFGKAFLKRQSAGPVQGMPSFGGEGPGGWVEREMKRRSAAGKQPGSRPSFGGDSQSAARAETKPSDGGFRSPVRSGLNQAEAHYEGYEKEAEWEARKQKYAQQDRTQLEADRRQTEEERTHFDQLRQGIIWSEILGPPRAKRPYGK